MTTTTITEPAPDVTEPEVTEPPTGEAPETGEAPAPGQELARYDPDSGDLVVPTHLPGYVFTVKKGQRELDKEQAGLLATLGIEAGWDAWQVAMFFRQCWVTGLDPWKGQAFLLKINGRYVNHTGIHGLLSKADDTHQYRGMMGPQWCGPDGVWRDFWPDKTTAPTAARAAALRADGDAILWKTVMYDEYAPKDDMWVDDPVGGGRVKTGTKTIRVNWRPADQGGKPAQFLGKCGMAAALRAAFPDKLGSWYIGEETEASRAEETGNPKPDPKRDARRAAYEAAQAEATNAGAPPVFVGLGYTDEVARALLFAELDEQAHILGRTRVGVTEKWLAGRPGQTLETVGLLDLMKFVGEVRRFVRTELTHKGRVEEAHRYAAAPPVGDCEALFGRPPAVMDATTVDLAPTTTEDHSAGVL